MAMVERYGIPPTRIASLMKAWQYPFRNVEKGDKFLILTDDAMDPMVWQSAMAALWERGAEPMIALYPRRAYHCADPSPLALAAAKEADAILALTSTALNSGTPGLREHRASDGAPIWLMEELTVEILLEGGGRAGSAEMQEINEIQRRIGEIYDNGKTIHVTSKSGTDLVADITGMPPGYFARRWGEGEPFRRNPRTGKIGGGTWPTGEIHVEPVPDTSNGVVVWDTTAHYPPGQWKNPVALTIKNGTIVSIDGGGEAEQVKWYLETYGDANSWRVGGEIALGTNKLCQPNTGMMRSEKKRYGAMHYGIGHGADRNAVNSVLRLEGICDRVTIVVDDNKVVCEDGKILV